MTVLKIYALSQIFISDLFAVVTNILFLKEEKSFVIKKMQIQVKFKSYHGL